MTVANPLRTGLRLERTPSPTTMVIFGATGDLSRRKLIPALYNLALEHLLPVGFAVMGVGRTEMTSDQFRDDMRKAVDEFSRRRPLTAPVWDSFAQGLFYHTAPNDDPSGYTRLKEELAEIDRTRATAGSRIFYLATPPSSYPTIIKQLGDVGLNQPAADNGYARIIIEKPFGHDLESARELNQQLLGVFDEHQAYRIDHYLGKETVQNLLVFRFGNGIFEPIWNRRYIDHVQITAAETLGVENRAAYYMQAGAIRDMMQSHVMQLLALVGMEPPVAFDANAVRDEKVKVLRSIHPMRGEDVVGNSARAQYAPGWVDGKAVPGFTQEPGVDPKTETETYVALKLQIDNWRFADVPFYVRTGKRLPKRVSEIAIQFRKAPLLLFRNTRAGEIEPNVLVIRIQPDEGISLNVGAKVPGPGLRVRSVNMDFDYGSSFSIASPDAYERLLLDCMLGDSTLFTRRDEVEAEWSIITDIMHGWQEYGQPHLDSYGAGTWGPASADRLLAQDGRTWRRP